MLNIHPLRWAVAPVAIGILILSGCGKQEQASAPAANTQPAPASSLAAKSPIPAAASPAGEMKAPVGEMKTAGGMKPQGTQCVGDKPVKGNVRGEKKIYHIPGSKGYDDTKPETCFKTAAEAEKAGFHAPK